MFDHHSTWNPLPQVTGQSRAALKVLARSARCDDLSLSYFETAHGKWESCQ